MNYIGSKRSLGPRIRALVAEYDGMDHALDLFAGTGIISELLAGYAKQVFAVDRQHYTVVLANARSARVSTEEQAELLHTLTQLAPLPETKFSHEYAEGGKAGRLYFSKENAAIIASIREAIRRMHTGDGFSKDALNLSLAWLLTAADQIANCASVYAAYLKKLKATALKPLDLTSAAKKYRGAAKGDGVILATAQDAQTWLEQNQKIFGLAYLDPPYNHRAYDANYHLLETITQWDLDQFVPRGKTGLRPVNPSSGWNSRVRVESTLQTTLDVLTANRLLFSYSDEGLLSEEQLRTGITRWGRITRWQKIPYRRYSADSNRKYTRSAVHEWLIEAIR